MKDKNDTNINYIGEPIYKDGKKYRRRMLNVKVPSVKQLKKIERKDEFYSFIFLLCFVLAGYVAFCILLAGILK